MNCINLTERFGQDYRIGHDPAAVTPAERHDPWMMTLPCQRGTIYPHGGDVLAVEVEGRPMTAARLAAIPGVRLHLDGTTEKTFLFPADLFPAVAAVVLPRKRRKLSPENRAKLAAAGTAALAGFRKRQCPERSADAPAGTTGTLATHGSPTE
jgi:hypothetical protein